MPTITGSKGSYRFSYEDRLDHRDTRGNMIGALFRGTCLDTQREVAIKLLGERAVANPVNIARTRAVVAAGIRHERVVELIDFCEEEDLHGDTYYFVVMELLQGENLADKLNGHFETHQAPFSEAEVLEYARQALPGLGAIHEKGLVHRDIDPSNLMLCGNVVKIIDLDIAYVPRDRERTNRGTRLGKLSYMPPEQIDGEETPAPDWDLYALGISMYQLLTGKLPYGVGEEAPTIHAIKIEPLPPNSRIAPWLFRVLEKATAKKSKDRYQSAEEFLAALERPASPPLWRPGPIPIPKWFFWIVGAVLLVAALWYFFRKLQNHEKEKYPAPIARIEVDSNGCEAPCTVTLRSVSGNTGEGTEYYWEDESGNTLSQYEQFSYEKPGNHRITLKVVNPDRQESRADTLIAIREAPLPVADVNTAAEITEEEVEQTEPKITPKPGNSPKPPRPVSEEVEKFMEKQIPPWAWKSIGRGKIEITRENGIKCEASDSDKSGTIEMGEFVARVCGEQ